MRRSLAILLTGGLLLLGSLPLTGGAAAATIAPPTTLSSGAAAATLAATTTCSNGVDNTGGLGLICEVTIVNTITASGGSARVTVRECHGAAGDPTAACTTKTTVLTKPVTAVTQCNDSINGGGGTLRCSVKVTNNFVGLKTGATAATVNQCVGSGGGITTGCDPFPATTTGATITQCNGSANGGTLVGLTCTATGTKPSSHGVRINQCNGSANGGGALVICSASITNKAAAGSTKLTSTGPTVAAPGATVTLKATLKTSAGAAIAGKTVTFTLHGVTRSAKTSSSGVATVVMTAPTPTGAYRIRIVFAGDKTHAAASTSATLSVRAASSGGALPNTATLATTTYVPASGTTPVVFVGFFLAALVVVASWLSLRAIRPR